MSKRLEKEMCIPFAFRFRRRVNSWLDSNRMVFRLNHDSIRISIFIDHLSHDLHGISSWEKHLSRELMSFICQESYRYLSIASHHYFGIILGVKISQPIEWGIENMNACSTHDAALLSLMPNYCQHILKFQMAFLAGNWYQKYCIDKMVGETFWTI